MDVAIFPSFERATENASMGTMRLAKKECTLSMLEPEKQQQQPSSSARSWKKNAACVSLGCGVKRDTLLLKFITMQIFARSTRPLRVCLWIALHRLYYTSLDRLDNVKLS